MCEEPQDGARQLTRFGMPRARKNLARQAPKVSAVGFSPTSALPCVTLGSILPLGKAFSRKCFSSCFDSGSSGSSFLFLSSWIRAKSDVFDSHRLHQTSAMIASTPIPGSVAPPQAGTLLLFWHHDDDAERSSARLTGNRRIVIDLPISMNAISRPKLQTPAPTRSEFDYHCSLGAAFGVWGALGRWRRPIQASAPMCLATSSIGGLRSSVHHVPTKVTMPMRALA